MKYAKLISSTELDYAPHTVTVGNTIYNPYPVELLLADGYKPVTFTPVPEREGYYYTPKYTETTAAIVQCWEEHESEPDPIELIRAQALFTAVMTDTLLEE